MDFPAFLVLLTARVFPGALGPRDRQALAEFAAEARPYIGNGEADAAALEDMVAEFRRVQVELLVRRVAEYINSR